MGIFQKVQLLTKLDIIPSETGARNRLLKFSPAQSREPAQTTLNADGFRATPTGDVVPVAQQVHGYEMNTYDADGKRPLSTQERSCFARRRGGRPTCVHTPIVSRMFGHFLPAVDQLGIPLGEAAVLAPAWFVFLEVSEELRRRNVPRSGTRCPPVQDQP